MAVIRSIFFLMCFCCIQAFSVNTIYFIYRDGNSLFNPNLWLSRPFYELKVALESAGYNVECVKEPKEVKVNETLYAISVNAYYFKSYHRFLRKLPKNKKILFMAEPPTVCSINFHPTMRKYFGRMLTWDDSLVDNSIYFKFCVPQFSLKPIESPLEFNRRKFSCLICSNKYFPSSQELYSKRFELIKFFSSFNNQDFDLYGTGWKSSDTPLFRGKCSSKFETTSCYKFGFAFENTKDSPGYITEKIFDVMLSGSVPVYLGAPNIKKYIPKNCYILASDFRSFDELYKYLKGVSEKEFYQYLENIRNFLQSDAAKLFSTESFIDNFFKVLNLKKKNR